MIVILPCIPDPTDFVLQGMVIGDASALDRNLAMAKAVPVSDIPALIPLMQGEVIGEYKMVGFPVPRAMIGQHPWYGIRPRMAGLMRQAGGLLEQVVIGYEMRLNPYDVFVDQTQAWQATGYAFDSVGMIVTLHEADVLGAEEAVDEGTLLPTPLFPEDPIVTIPRGAIFRSGLARRNTSVVIPATFGRHTTLDSFTETTNRWFVAGVTRTGAGAALGGCRVVVLQSDKFVLSPDILANPVEDDVVSDGSGLYSVQVPNSRPRLLVASKDENLAGVTVVTVTPEVV